MQPGYKPRRFDESPLFQLVYHHFDDLQEMWHREYSERLGPLREIVVHTANRYLMCGDPREGIARYECSQCSESITVPFSCKTRLFCPTCHEKKILLWLEELQRGLLLDVPHRFWTFSVPKRLRYYFMRNRKLLGLLVHAAHTTICKSLGEGNLVKGVRPGIVTLIQTHGDSLDWNSHLHQFVTDGVVDYTTLAKPKFKPCKFWDMQSVTQIFRFELIELMFKAGVLTSEVANNLMSWKHSGFHVHATAPFKPADSGGELLRNRLAYAFRPAVSLNRLSFDGERVKYQSRRQLLDLTPVEFLAKLTLHIPDRYQNIRRYAGFYSSPIQRRVRAVRDKNKPASVIDEAGPIKPSWARLIAKVFGAIPVLCPKCGRAMELKEFILDVTSIERHFPGLARAPPQKTFERYMPNPEETVYCSEDDSATVAEFDQTRTENDEDFNQEIES